MKVIFLDIDGVMNCYNSGERWQDRKDRVAMIHDNLVERLNQVVKKTGCKLVLSSTWRKDKDWKEKMKKSGIANCFLGRTPSMPRPIGSSSEYMERGKEIEAWIDEWETGVFPNCTKPGLSNESIEKYCIIDDDSDMLPHQKHFKTSIYEGGLTEEIAQEVINFLNSK